MVLYHYTARGDITSFPLLAPLSQFGYLGVPLFFMISGFVISASAENRTPAEFVVSRITRLFPAYWFGIGFTLAVMFLLEQNSLPIRQILMNMTMLNDYLGIKNIDGVYWTLQVELKFYACIFLLLATKTFSKTRYWVTGWLIMTIVYAACKQPFFMPWFINPDYSVYFISGVVAYLIFKDGLSHFTLMLYFASAALAVYFCIHQVKGFASWADQAHVITAAVITLILHGIFLLIATRKLNVKSHPLYLLLGGLTYPIYLIHNRAGKIFIDTFATPETLAWVTTLAIALVIGVAFIIYKFIEPPLSKVLRHSLQRALRRMGLTA